MLAEYKARAQGTVDRRRSLRLSAFAAITVDVPPLAEQRRIVDLVAAVDTARFSDRVTDACGAAARALMNEIMASASDWVALASVVSKARAGGTPSRQEPSFFGGSIPWLKSGEVDADWIDRATESLTEPGLANSSAWVMPSRSIVIAMYGQGLTAGSVGFTAVPMAANQAVLGLVPDPNRVEPRFLFHWLRSRKDSMRDRRSGSSQPNLNKETVIQEPVPVVELDRQRVVASVLDALSETSGNSSKVVAAAERARTALVADLLSGEHEIPESYDRFLEGAS
jgi:type I restriction enzyme S subunit